MRFFSTWNICNGSTRNTSFWRGKGSPCEKMDSDTVIHHLRLKTVLSKAKEDELLQITSGLKRAHYLIDHLSVFVLFYFDLFCFLFCFFLAFVFCFCFLDWRGGICLSPIVNFQNGRSKVKSWQDFLILYILLWQ